MNNIANGNDNKQFFLLQFGSPTVQSVSLLEDTIFRSKLMLNEWGFVNNTGPQKVLMLFEFDRTKTDWNQTHHHKSLVREINYLATSSSIWILKCELTQWKIARTEPRNGIWSSELLASGC
jgi:hypothetical protein